MILISNMISLYSESKCSFYHTLWIWPMMMIDVWHHLTSSCGTTWEPKCISSVLIFQQYLSCDWKYIRKVDINFENREFLILLPLKLKVGNILTTLPQISTTSLLRPYGKFKKKTVLVAKFTSSNYQSQNKQDTFIPLAIQFRSNLFLIYQWSLLNP